MLYMENFSRYTCAHTTMERFNFNDPAGKNSYSPHEEEALKLDLIKALHEERYRVHACRAVKIPYQMFLGWMDTDEEFRHVVEEVEVWHAEEISRAIRHRAIDGVPRTRYYRDQPLETEIVYSDLLLIFEAKRRDSRYRDRQPAEEMDPKDVKLYDGVDTSKI